jgi:tetratricopeptide (TPR) repeat protein
MAGRPPASEPGTNFCAQCGARLPASARFCPGCGQPLAEPARHGESPRQRRAAAAAPARTLRDQLPGLTVLTLFLAVGLTIWVTVLRPGAPTSSAPSRSAPPAGAGNMPPDHPPIALPDEAKKFLSSLATKANAAPTDVGAWRNLAQVQARAAEVDASYLPQAIESYRHVVSLAPDDGDALRGLANLYYDQQQYASAAEQYERYLKLKPDDPNVRTDLATTYLYQRQVDRAIELYGKVLEANPDFLQAHFNLGLAYEAKGEHAKALDTLAKARALAPDESTRTQIDRVTAQMKGEAAGAAPPGAGAAALMGGEEERAAPPGAAAPAGAGAAATTAGAAAAGGAATGGAAGAPADAASATRAFRDEVEATLRGHQILGPKITGIEWPEPTRARVLLANFPIQMMPEGPRSLFRGRLETILDDAKTKHGVSEESAIDLVDATTGESMERVTH